MCVRGGGGLLRDRMSLVSQLWSAGIKSEVTLFSPVMLGVRRRLAPMGVRVCVETFEVVHGSMMRTIIAVMIPTAGSSRSRGWAVCRLGGHLVCPGQLHLRACKAGTPPPQLLAQLSTCSDSARLRYVQRDTVLLCGSDDARRGAQCDGAVRVRQCAAHTRACDPAWGHILRH